MEARTPAQILEFASDAGAAKARRAKPRQFVLAFMAGAFIAFASGGSTMAAFNLLARADAYGLGRALAGAVFGTGLMLVVVAGGELFTGNALLLVSALDRRIKTRQMLSNWLVVYAGNFAGGVFVAYMMSRSMLFDSGGGMLGGQTVRIAASKTALSFESAFFLGLMCNWLVCLAVWVSYAARDVAGKLLACFFVIGLFIASGFEHSVANMYYIPAGIMAKANPLWAGMSGLSPAQLAGLNWLSFAAKNLVPVTLGNVVGGAGMVGGLYWAALRGRKEP
jgi:formate/nitrite transporter